MDRLFRVAQTGSGRDYHAPTAIALPEDTLIDIEFAEYAGEYAVAVRFSDKVERVIDFGPFLSSSLNPLIRRYLDKKMFKDFRVEYGDLIWGDYDLCFPVADLYEGRL